MMMKINSVGCHGSRAERSNYIVPRIVSLKMLVIDRSDECTLNRLELICT